MHRFITKYKNMADPIKASLWFVIASIIQRGISFITTPIFTRLLTTDEYGSVSVFHSWYGIFSIFLTLNLASGVYNKAMTKWADKRDEVTASMLGLTSVVTLSFLIVYLFAIDFWNSIFNMNTPLMLTIFIQSYFSIAYSFWAAGQRYDYKYRMLVIVSLAIAIVSPILGILAVKMVPYKAEARIISLAFVQIVIGFYFYIRIIRKGRKIYSKQFWLYALQFNIPLIPHYLAQTVLGSSDRIMISNMVGNSQAAIYDIAYIISTITSLLTTAVNDSFIPYTFKAIKAERTENVKKYTIYLSTFVLAICVLAICFGPEIIRIIATPDYYEARWVVPPVAAAIFFTFIRSFYCNIEFYYEKTKFVMVASSGAAVLNVVLNYLFIPVFGYIAAAYTTLVCYIILMLLHYCMYRIVCRKMKLNRVYNDRVLFFMGILILSFMGIITIFYDYLIVRYSIVVVIVMSAFVYRKKLLSLFKEIK